MKSVATDVGTTGDRTQEGLKSAVLVDTDKVRAHVADIIDEYPLGWSSWQKRKRTYNSRGFEILEMRYL